MIVAIADTHAAIWYLFNDPRLSAQARNVVEQAVASGKQVGISSISWAEIVYLYEKGRVPQHTFDSVLVEIRDPVKILAEVAVTNQVAERMRHIPRQQVPELPDRIIAATGLLYEVPVISRDRKIRAASLETIW